MIREFQKSDIEQVMRIWLMGNTEAHPFIPEDYWKSNFEEVQKQISQADVLVYEAEGSILGFMGIVEGYIAGIFVDEKYRSAGIGKQLLNDAKRKNNALSLSVYQKNKRAVEFYLREGFLVSEEGVDEDTGEVEYGMVWKIG